MIDKTRLKKAKDVLNVPKEPRNYDIVYNIHNRDNREKHRKNWKTVLIVALVTITVVWVAIANRHLNHIWYDNVLIRMIVDIHSKVHKH